jgi:hypothetical protein
MMPKTWRDPHSETASSFVLAAGSGALGAAAVGSLEVDLLLYPAYFGAVNAGTAAVILLRRRSVATAPTPPTPPPAPPTPTAPTAPPQPWAAVVSPEIPATARQ